MNRERLGQIRLPAPEDFDPHPRLLLNGRGIHAGETFHALFPDGWREITIEMSWEPEGPRLLVHLHPRVYPHLSHRSVRKGIGRDTTSIKYAANKYYILCFLLDTSYILWYNAPVNEFCAISLIGAWT